MVKPYSVDLRERVIRFVMSGHSRHAAAAQFGVSVSSAIKWVAAYLARGEIAPKPLGGLRFSKLDPHRLFLIAEVEKQPHLTMAELAAALAAKGTMVDPVSISRWLRRNSYRYKKPFWRANKIAPTSELRGSNGQKRDSRRCDVSRIGLSLLMATWVRNRSSGSISRRTEQPPR